MGRRSSLIRLRILYSTVPLVLMASLVAVNGCGQVEKQQESQRQNEKSQMRVASLRLGVSSPQGSFEINIDSWGVLHDSLYHKVDDQTLVQYAITYGDGEDVIPV